MIESAHKPKWKTRLVKDNSPAVNSMWSFWQEQGDEAIFRAAWEMAELAERLKHDREPTLDKTVTRLGRLLD
jgi:hypothetical protein